jgi:hypothetical protein
MLDNDAPDSLDRIADVLEKMPSRLARAMRQEGIGRGQQPSLGRQIIQAKAEAYKVAKAERRANIAIALTAVTALGSLIAAIATLFSG